MLQWTLKFYRGDNQVKTSFKRLYFHERIRGNAFSSLNVATVPRSPFGEERLFGDMNAGMAGGIAGLVLIVAVTTLFIFLWLIKRRRERQDPAERGAIALGKHPNVVRATLHLTY